MLTNFEIRVPALPAEWDAYFELRWATLRRPWKIPETLDDDEADSFHLAAFSVEGQVLGTGRLVSVDENTAQIRSMAVLAKNRKCGVGRALLQALEKEARGRGFASLILHAREEAVPFYERCGYRLVKPSYVLQEVIPHFLMERNLEENA